MKIICPTCRQHYEVAEDMAGSEVECQKCGERFVVPKPQTAPSVNLIRCPDCGSTVSRRAEACPKCGAPISPRKPIQAPPPQPPKETVWNRNRGCGDLILWPILIIIIIIFIVPLLARGC